MREKPLPLPVSARDAEARARKPAPAERGLLDGEFVRYELRPKDKVMNLRLPGPLLDALWARAKETGIPCQRLIRVALERMLRDGESG